MSDVTSDRLTWGDLVRAEPLLADLERECAVAAESPSHCAFRAWYGGRSGVRGAKHRLVHLVGWCRRSPEWHTPIVAGRLYSGRELRERHADDEPGRVSILAEDIAHGREWLWTSAAYDIAYRHLLSTIGDCAEGGGCGCWA